MKEGDYHDLTIEKTLRSLSSSKKGISQKQAQKRKIRFGSNTLPDDSKKPVILTFLKQFNNLMIYVLIAALLISLYLHHLVDVYVISVVILFNAIIGFIQEYRAEKAIQALKKMIVLHAKVYRNKHLTQISAEDLVPGDVILLTEGDKIPADARLIQTTNFSTMESILTGESHPSEKNTNPLPESTELADRKNMVWMGTFVASGQALAVVTSTGSSTAIGKIASSLKKIKPPKSHFHKKTDKLTKQVSFLAFGAAIILFSIGVWRGFKLPEIFLFTLASLVSSIPEGLPAIMVVVLAIGSRRMAKRKAIIRNLPSTETLGVVDTVITDKTGTLTENTMTVEKIIIPNQEDINITGKGWSSKGEFIQGKKFSPKNHPVLNKLLEECSLLSEAQVIYKNKEYTLLGDPTEASLSVLLKKAGITSNERRIKEIPFNSTLKYKACLTNNQEIYILSAPEILIDKSKYFLNNNQVSQLTIKQKKELYSKLETLADKSMRVLAVGYKKSKQLSEEDIKETIFVGLIGIRDPPRKEVRESIQKARKAGIRVIMVTGDHKKTALAISKEIGLTHSIEPSQALSQKELEKLSNKEFQKAIRTISVFARLTPVMKLKIATEIQKAGHLIAMTGDGVNDAPALKKADIGVSMGIVGTDVARESSQMVLADDNFSTIISAIEQGRIVFSNARRSTTFLVTTNVAEDITLITALLIGYPLPLLPTQILWLNLVTDGTAGLALSVEPKHEEVLEMPPRKPKEEILSKGTLPFLIFMSISMLVLTLFTFKSLIPLGIETARTGVFAIMSFTQFFNVFNLRSMKKSIFKINPFSNKSLIFLMLLSVALFFAALYFPLFKNALGFSHLTLNQVLRIIACSSIVLILGEIYKFIKNNLKTF